MKHDRNLPGIMLNYINHCPIGCEGNIENSGIILPEGPLRRCSSCGQLFSQCSLNRYLDSMQEFDDPDGTWQTGEGLARLRKFTKRIIRRVERFLETDRTEIHLLDVGCSSGSFVAAAARLGVHAEGVEPEPAPVETGKSRGLKIHQGFLEDVKLPKDSLDVITLFEVIEHLKAPQNLLEECYRVLKPGGVVVIKTGNADSWTVRYMGSRWEYFHISIHGGHVSFFNPRSMRNLAENCGFVVERLDTHRISFYRRDEVPYILFRISKLFSSMLDLPSSWLGKGHDLIAFLKKPHEPLFSA